MSKKSVIYEFGRFRLDLAEQRLMRDTEAIPLSPKVLDTLVVLVEHSGHILGKDELMKAVWPDTFVEESSLAQNISLLRKALNGGDEQRFIETVPKRGYRFVAPVSLVEGNSDNERSAVLPGAEEVASAKEATDYLPAPINGNQVGLVPDNALRTSHLQLALLPSTRSFAIAGVVLLLAAVLAGGYLWRLRNRQQAKLISRQQDVQSLAVLPFRTLSSDRDDTILSLGLADALILRLSMFEQSRIRPTSSIFKYAGKDVDTLNAGRELGVDAVVDGTVQHVGERVRVTVALIRLKDGKTLWSEKYDEKFTDIFTLQDSVSAQVAGVLQLQLNDSSREMNKRFTENAAAYRNYTMGLFFWSKRTKDGLSKAVDYFRQAINEDPNYAAAYASLSDAYLLSAYYGYDLLPLKETYKLSREMAMKAVELDNTLSEAHTAMAIIEAFEGDAVKAEESFRLAINLNPNSDTAHLRYGNFLVDRSRLGEAVLELQRAQEINPVSPTNATALGSFLLFAGQYDKSIEYSKLALEIDPQFGLARDNLGVAYGLKGMYPEAIQQFTTLSRQPEFWQYGEVGLAWISARMGNANEAQVLLARLEKEARCGKPLPDLPFDIAVVRVALREDDLALAWLQTAAQGHRLRLHQLEYTADLSLLKNDSRFIKIMDLVRNPKQPLSEVAD